jgi:two-component system response regulator GlrR
VQPDEDDEPVVTSAPATPMVEYPPIEPVEPPIAAPEPAPSPAPPAAQPPPVATTTPATYAPPEVSGETLELLTLLADLQRYGTLPQDDVRREVTAATQLLNRQRTDANRVRLAVLFTLAKNSPQDDQRALQLLENVAKSNPGSPAIKQVAFVLQAQISERLRAVKDEQQKADAAIQKLGRCGPGNAACCGTASAAGGAAPPEAAPEAAAAVVAVALAAAAVSGNESARRKTVQTGDILLVDDDPDLLKLISLRLSSAGYRVRTADSGEAALASLAVARPAAVITDLRMPGIDGLQLFEAIHRQHPALPVIILTAHGTIPDAVSATQRGVFGFLTKPFDSQELLQLVASALRLAGDAPMESSEAIGEWRAGIITRSPQMEDLLRQARLVADSDASVLVYGDSGTGKELLARAIHRASPRGDKPFVAVNCGAIPEPLLESELFGHARGAFSGAVQAHKGLFQSADGGTIFLDEIGDMPLPLQVKLLRVLQEGEVRPVGATQALPVDVRVISATHRDLDAYKASGQFREDLYYRLNVVSLRLPALADRREDVPLLATHFLRRLAERYKRPAQTLAPDAMALLISAPWPGNVRQLLNLLEQAVALATTNIIPASLIQSSLREDASALVPFEEAGRIRA